MLRSVVFPAPEGANNVRKAPLSMEIEKPERITLPA
jgi:hypothetical protein